MQAGGLQPESSKVLLKPDSVRERLAGTVQYDATYQRVTANLMYSLPEFVHAHTGYDQLSFTLSLECTNAKQFNELVLDTTLCLANAVYKHTMTQQTVPPVVRIAIECVGQLIKPRALFTLMIKNTVDEFYPRVMQWKTDIDYRYLTTTRQARDEPVAIDNEVFRLGDDAQEWVHLDGPDVVPGSRLK